MIVGIGTDVAEIARFARALDRFGERFVRRILTDAERARYERTAAKARAGHLAKRFAAKEAFSKAIGTGIHAPFTWHSVTVGRDPRGKPVLLPREDMAAHLASLGVVRSHVSLTDDAGVAFAFVVLEG
jgi:holo-[acyl-carrier protein] synthase